MTKYCFVIDADGTPLSPTKEIKGWYMVRKGKAVLISKYPMTIQLKRTIPYDEICKDEVRCGIDDGGLHTGIAIVQKCKTKNKVLFKGTIEQRNDVKHLIATRRGYRKYRRYHKRYRKERFSNRKSTRKNGRVAPSVLQKKQATMRIIYRLTKWTKIDTYWLEDVAIDIRALTDGYKPYKWQYQQTNRLDENIRKAVILRDGYKCMECGKGKTSLEVHHIKPKRLNGSNTLGNLITLCGKCHQKTEGKEEQYMQHFFDIIGSSDDKNLNYASYVMIGKKWLRKQLCKLGNLTTTNGGDTANKRIDWDIEKTHSNDAICITSLKPDTTNIEEWTIRPMRKKRKNIVNKNEDFRHRDFIKYKPKSSKISYGYITSVSSRKGKGNFTDLDGKEHKGISFSSCVLLWRFSHIFWLNKMIELN